MYECSNVQPYVHPLGLMLQCGLDDSFRRQTGYNGPSQGPANGSQKACDYGAFKTPLYGVSPAYTGTQNTHKPLAGGSIPPVGTIFLKPLPTAGASSFSRYGVSIVGESHRRFGCSMKDRDG